MKPASGSAYIVLGIMSGTSLDGLDLAICSFSKCRRKWMYKLLESKTVEYDAGMRSGLKNSALLSAEGIIELDNEFGLFIGRESKKFIEKTGLNVSLISSHGHTVFHQPGKGLIFQAGNGACISALTGIATVTDYRRADVTLGGQGAPLVPAGDEFLFSEFDYCLNLGGFANISYRSGKQRIAYDICPVNIILNQLAGQKGKIFDRDGLEGSSGNINNELLARLNDLDFYRLKPPKSLGREWLENEFIPVLDKHDLPAADKMRTVYEHIAGHIASIPRKKKIMLVTGGGAHNKFLMDLIRKHCQAECIVPDKSLVDFKEAIIFAFLGLLRLRNEINCFASVTGASRDSCCGVINLGTVPD